MQRNARVFTRILICSALIPGGLSACVHRVESGDGTVAHMTTGELRRYARSVFEYHNQTVSELMFFTATDKSLQVTERKMLEKAEYEMYEACSAINDVAVNIRDTGSAKLKEKMEVPDSLGQCERASHKVDILLDTLEDN